jgi:hypothetical protein
MAWRAFQCAPVPLLADSRPMRAGLTSIDRSRPVCEIRHNASKAGSGRSMCSTSKPESPRTVSGVVALSEPGIAALELTTCAPGRESPAACPHCPRTSPAVGASFPTTQSNNVLFPQPFGPIRANHSPAGTRRETSLRTTWRPYAPLRPRTSRLQSATAVHSARVNGEKAS